MCLVSVSDNTDVTMLFFYGFTLIFANKTGSVPFLVSMIIMSGNLVIYNYIAFVFSVKMSLRKQTPSDFLKQIIGRPVVVKLNSGVDYRGTSRNMYLFYQSYISLIKAYFKRWLSCKKAGATPRLKKKKDKHTLIILRMLQIGIVGRLI